MIKNITIGQYIPRDSIIHKTDPRIKILITFFYIISIFFIKNICLYMIPFIYIIISIYFSKLNYKIILSTLKPLKIILLLTFLINLFFYTSGDIIFKLYFITITKDGLMMSLQFCIRILLLVAGSSILTLTTSPMEISNAIECLLSPLKKIKFPVHELSMMMNIALRFIPTLADEADKIMKAQISRGANFDGSNLLEKAKSMIPLLVPLFVSSFRRAYELSMAMESRCYHGDINRTKYRVLKYKCEDIIVFVISLIFYIPIFVFYIIL